MADMICHKVYELLMSILNIYIYILYIEFRLPQNSATVCFISDEIILL
jgi:hypothetical protein